MAVYRYSVYIRLLANINLLSWWRKIFSFNNDSTWALEQEHLKEEFLENKWARLDTTISMEFADLIKKQIDISNYKRKVNVATFDNRYYKFINKTDSCNDSSFCMNGEKLYIPVFNTTKDKACYLFSYACRNGICRDFIFIGWVDDKWQYVVSYPSHLIGKDN